jgi:hypothetical protein
MRYVPPALVLLAFAVLAACFPAARRPFLVLFALAALYALLKLTGVFEALAPGRSGVL